MIIVVFSIRKNGWAQAQLFQAEKLPNGYFKLGTNLSSTKYNDKENRYNLSPEQLKTVDLFYKASDEVIKKWIPKGNTVDEVYEDISKSEKLRNRALSHALNHVLTANDKIIQFIESEPNIDCFFNISNITSIFEDDRITNISGLCIPEFVIELGSEKESYYKIQIKNNNQPIEFIYNSRLFAFLPSSNVAFIMNKKLYKIKGLNFRQIEYFVKNNTPRTFPTPTSSNDNTFILKTIRDFDVVAKNFKINKHNSLPIPLLTLTQMHNNNLALSLSFTYDRIQIEPNNPTKALVAFKEDEKEKYFEKWIRNTKKENELIELLKRHNLQEIHTPFASSELYLAPKNLDQSAPQNHQLTTIIEWFSSNHKTLIENQIDFTTLFNDYQYFTGDVTLSSSISGDMDWFDLKSTVKIGEYEIPFARFRKNILSGDRFFQVTEELIFIIPEEWFSKYGDLFHYAEEVGDILRLAKGLKHLINESSDTTINLVKNNTSQNTSFVLSDSPEGLKGTLRPYQLEGFHWMQNLNNDGMGGILADDMGLGKTVQIIALLYQVNKRSVKNDFNKGHNTEAQTSLSFEFAQETYLPRDQTIPASLILVPTSLVFNWKLEFEKFAPHLKVLIFNEKIKTNHFSTSYFTSYDVVLLSYGLLQNRLDLFLKYRFNYIILDESQYIKNPASKRYAAVIKLKANHRLAMSGTPIENSLTDLWAQMNFLNPGLLKTLKQFKERYINPIEKKSDSGDELAQKLLHIIRPLILRRTKEMVVKELPPITIQTIYCDMTENQKSAYEKHRSEIRREYLERRMDVSPKDRQAFALKAITRLRQAANHPKLADAEYQFDSGKFDEIIESIENVIVENHNVLIFSQFAELLKLFETEAQERKWEYAKITGSVKDREAEVEKFNKNENCRIFFITTKAGGTGLNLTKADYVFMTDPWWNEAAEYQAFARAHRIGQTKPVFVFRYISNETLEQKIIQLQTKKSATADRFIHPNEHSGIISDEELNVLISE